MRLAFISTGSPFAESSWSGIPYFSLREVRRRFGDVHVINTATVDSLIFKSHYFARYGWQAIREPLQTAVWARFIESRLQAIEPDFVISLNASHKVVDLPRRRKVVHISDGTFGPMVNYYDKYNSLGSRTRALGDRLERKLLDRVHSMLLTSQWAISETAAYYMTDPGQLTLAPMGANLLQEPAVSPPREVAKQLKLLFVGYDWVRKGGPLALEALRLLRKELPGTELHIVGVSPAAAHGVPGAIVHGPIDKGDPAGHRTLTELYRDAHFFVMPSRQEAYGLVYCEAAAFGLPVIACDTGGVGTIVKDGVSGLLLPAAATAHDIAGAIRQVWSDPERYQKLQIGSRQRFEQRLNWRSWGDILEGALSKDRS